MKPKLVVDNSTRGDPPKFSIVHEFIKMIYNELYLQQRDPEVTTRELIEKLRKDIRDLEQLIRLFSRDADDFIADSYERKVVPPGLAQVREIKDLLEKNQIEKAVDLLRNLVDTFPKKTYALNNLLYLIQRSNSEDSNV